MRLAIDSDRCTGHGRCYTTTSELYSYDEEGYGAVLVDEVPADKLEAAEATVRGCPERAITLFRQDG
jgi:ferredoxin